VDGADVHGRMSVGCTNTACTDRRMDVVGEAVSAGEKAKILLPTDGLTNAICHGAGRVHAR
jgi:hypothetical protein